jgi:hypothetical protein
MASKSKSTPKSRALAPTPATAAPLAAASPSVTPAEVLAPLNGEADALAVIIDRILVALDSLGAKPKPSDARRIALQVEAELMRASIRLAGLRTKASALAQHAHVAELAAMAGEVAR